MTGLDRAFGTAALVLAVERGAEFGAFDGRYVVLAETMLQSLGPQLVESVRPGEQLGLVAPVQVVARAKISPGAVAITDQRVIVAWCEGVAMAEVHVVTSALVEVRDVERRTRRAMLSPNLSALGFWAGSQYLEIVFSTAVRERLVATVQMGLTRAVTFGVDDGAIATERREFGLTFDALPHPRGALIAAVAPGSAADTAGLLAGVVVTHVHGRRVDDADHAASLLAASASEAAVALRCWRDGTPHEVVLEAPVRRLDPPQPVEAPAVDSGQEDFRRAFGLTQQMPVGERAASMAPHQITEESTAVVDAFIRGDFQDAWQRRLELGYGVPAVGVEPMSLFWLDAAAALAALHLGLRDHPLVAACCGMATSKVDRRDPGQSVVVRELEQLYLAR